MKKRKGVTQTMGRKMGKREKILYRFEKARKTLHRTGAYMAEIIELAENRSIHIAGKCPAILNACLELEELTQEVEDCFRVE